FCYSFILLCIDPYLEKRLAAGRRQTSIGHSCIGHGRMLLFTDRLQLFQSPIIQEMASSISKEIYLYIAVAPTVLLRSRISFMMGALLQEMASSISKEIYPYIAVAPTVLLRSRISFMMGALLQEMASSISKEIYL